MGVNGALESQAVPGENGFNCLFTNMQYLKCVGEHITIVIIEERTTTTYGKRATKVFRIT